MPTTTFDDPAPRPEDCKTPEEVHAMLAREIDKAVRAGALSPDGARMIDDRLREVLELEP